ncbi:DNA polymerase III subunit gamma/tau [Candidatus Vidania fulgoroideorum]
MNNKFLYNKYKPLNLEDFIGQKKIIKIITYLINNKNVPCNYVFYGPKGTGKTSFSRIFFKILNCKNSFKNCFDKSCLCKKKFPFEFDFLEIDAASNRKIEEIKEIIKFKDYVPVLYRYKVISIDEAQMLSSYSFNFLLKCIEDSNDNFIIIFITTSFEKIPETIRSRCMCLEFEKISSNEIFLKIKEISEKEKINFDEKSLKLISKKSDGSMRDSLVLLDKIVALTENKVFYNSVIEILGTIDIEEIKSIFRFIINGKKKEMIDFITSNFSKRNINSIEFIKNIHSYVNKTLLNLYKLDKNNEKIISVMKLRDCLFEEISFLKNINNNQYLDFFCTLIKCFLNVNDT